MEKKTISIDKLVANPENPRFDPVEDEQEAIETMISNIGEKLLNLAKDIAEYGFNPSKRVIVTPVRGGKYIVQEGNRRLIAAKLLKDPKRANNDEYENKFRALNYKFKSEIPDEVDCVVFPRLEDANRWINLEHTGANDGRGVLSWNSEQGQRFLAQTIGKKPAPEIQVFDLADSCRINHDDVDSTTLRRLIRMPAIRRNIGIDFRNGHIILTKSQAETKKVLKKIFSAMSADSFKVGDIYTVEKAKLWLREVLKDEPEERLGKIKKTSIVTDTVQDLGFTLPVQRSHKYSSENVNQILRRIALRFHLISKQLGLRFNNRETLLINDEYDVQDLFRSILKLFFDDVRKESQVPQHIGGSSRMDILLQSNEFGLEIKMTRKGLDTAKKVGDEIIVDIARYKKHPNCRNLFCFIYDPDGYIDNPEGLVKDLRLESQTNFRVEALINQSKH